MVGNHPAAKAAPLLWRGIENGIPFVEGNRKRHPFCGGELMRRDFYVGSC